MLLQCETANALAIMPMGDSITKGFHEAGGSYRLVLNTARPELDMVGSFYDAAGYSFDADHQGVSGYQIQQMTAEYGPAVALYQPDVVLLLAGTNNHFTGATMQDYLDLIAMIRSNAPNARIIAATVPKFGYDRVPATAYWTDTWVDDRNSVVIPGINASLRQAIAHTQNADLVDYYAALDPATDLVADAVHPNVSGQTRLGELFLAELSRLPADLDQDGDVDDADFGIAFSHFTGPGVGDKVSIEGNLDGDGDVDDADFGFAFAAFTGPGGAVHVPEPASLVLLAGGLFSSRRHKS